MRCYPVWRPQSPEMHYQMNPPYPFVLGNYQKLVEGVQSYSTIDDPTPLHNFMNSFIPFDEKLLISLIYIDYVINLHLL